MEEQETTMAAIRCRTRNDNPVTFSEIISQELRPKVIYALDAHVYDPGGHAVNVPLIATETDDDDGWLMDEWLIDVRLMMDGW